LVSTGHEVYVSPRVAARHARQLTLLDLLDRLLAGGVVIHGDITLAAADIDLVEVRLGVLVSAVQKLMER
jgi:Gas vesicle protein